METWSDLQIVIPVYNDWDSVRQLLPRIAEALRQTGVEADVLLVNDGSQAVPPQDWKLARDGLGTVRIAHLYRNLGHQRAICVALCILRGEQGWRRVAVMDGDGEDDPADIARLLRELQETSESRIVFAERARRSEGLVFRLGYRGYTILHRILVGQRVRVGNFSVLNRPCLESLCASPELWNHFAAAAFATRQPMRFVPTHRAARLAGRSQMNLPSLVTHGLSALSVFADRISTRLLLACGALGLLLLAAMLAVVLIRVWTGLAIPGWATTAFGILTVLLVQLGTFMLTCCFLILSSRGLSPFLPVRDSHYFVRRIEEVWHADRA